MKHLTILLFSAILACGPMRAQYATPPAIYPGGVATDQDLKVETNGTQTSLLASIAISATTASVYSCTNISANSLATIDTEIVPVLSCSGNIMTFDTGAPGCTAGRACDGSVAAAHLQGAPVSLFSMAWHHNVLRVEVEAIEAALGANLANVVSAGQTLTAKSNASYAGFFAIGATGFSRFVTFQTAAGNGACAGSSPCSRWVIQASTDAESSGNAGSNFQILRYADNGTVIDTPFSINRATGILTVNALLSNGTIQGVSPAGGLAGLFNSTSGNLGTATLEAVNAGTNIAFQATSSGTTAATFTGSGGSCSIVPTTTSLSCTSDARKKQDDLTITDGLDKVMALRPLTFRWRSDPNGARHDGFFAQEMQRVIPSLVSEGKDGFLMANYTGVIPYLVSAIQQMQGEIESLRGSHLTGDVH